MNGNIGMPRSGWTRRAVLKAAGGTALAASAAGLALPRSRSAWAATQRPIEDFLGAQGTTSMFFPPVPDYVGWTVQPTFERFALVDYAGLAAAFLSENYAVNLGTSVSGSARERPLADGRAEVSVFLSTSNALAWASEVDVDDFANSPLLFGARAGDVAGGAQAALGSSRLKAVFTNTAPGALLPDLVAAFILGGAAPGQELRSLSFHAEAAGPLHADFDVPEGTPGRLTVSQTGLFMTGFQGATADGFPAERVDLHVVGQ